MLMWITIAVGSIGLLILLVWLIGLRCPETCTAHIELFMKATPGTIWTAMQDVEKHPVGARMTKSVTRLPDENGMPVWEEDLGSSRITIQTIDSTPEARLKRACRDSIVPMTAEIEITFGAVQGGTKINAVNTTTVRKGTWHVPMVRLALRFTDALERGLKDYFRQIGRTLDTEPRFHARPGQKPDSPRMHAGGG